MGIHNRITEPCDLLDENGCLTNPGYATLPLWRYDRKKIKAAGHRIKEWDYYYVVAPEQGFGITFTIADLGYIGMAAVCWLDFRKKTSCQVDTLSFFPMGRLNLPLASDSGRTRFENKKLSMCFYVDNGYRHLMFETHGFSDDKSGRRLKGDILLSPAQDADSMAAKGVVTMGDTRYEVKPGDAFAGLDWGRGYWTYKNLWYWGSASGMLGKESFGWNIGYGFSDRTPASENMVFYKGVAHKLADILFEMDDQDYMKPWKISSSDNRFEMDFIPLLDRQSAVDFKLIKSI